MLKTIAFSVWILAAGVAPTQEASTVLEVAGDVETPLRLSADDLTGMPRASARVTSDGVETLYEGVFLHELLRRAGVPLGEELRG